MTLVPASQTRKEMKMKVTPTRLIQRVNTVNGMAPSTGCAKPEDVKKRALVPYEADYFFLQGEAAQRT